ncbi:cilia- and flagella-associated protein 221 isoform X1 [Takifugu flavidus]|uniref:cilia- and flagella-associated protein 221 isoform X1 n=1 Tax=Takifugu flavidus TaxID=433684 RepID=UPI0025447EAC|nr:cilia- and flagella-associated protein 221 isoform X1 [Takifugu flavidus]
MEVALSAPQSLSRGAALPLSQLLEENRGTAHIPNPLESKIYAKLKSNRLIQAEPAELHFSAFELQKDYIKILKLINISSEVMNIHIIPTQTRHFQTSYTKKYRLVPGLAYALKVRFCPDEWRYFYDCIRVHCKGDENLLIPVHGYPVINDLHIPSRIDLPASPLGKSVRRAILLTCSSPIDFAFQVYIIESHEAFSIHPLRGVIQTGGEGQITVTFTPVQYETSQFTFQVVISQFNTKPYLCTVTGSSAPHLMLSATEKNMSHVDGASVFTKRTSSVTQSAPQCKINPRAAKKADKSQTSGALTKLEPQMDSGVAKLSMKDPSKLTIRDVREAISCDSSSLQDRWMKEAALMRKIQEKENHIRWQVHLGEEPVSEKRRSELAVEREAAQQKYMVSRRGGEYFTAGQKLSFHQVLFEAGQVCKEVPSFQLYPSLQLDLEKRALKQFQQGARKVAIRCRMSRRLNRLRKQAGCAENPPSSQKAEEKATCMLKITPDRIFPFTFPNFPDEDDPLALSNLRTLPVDPIEVTVTTDIPVFNLQVRSYELMGYQSVSTWKAFNSYIPVGLVRPLRALSEVEVLLSEEEEEIAHLSFTAPEALLGPPIANPFRIFNPAPGLRAYKPTLKYLEGDLEWHLCPLPRYQTCEHDTSGRKIKLAKQKDVTWKSFDWITLNCLSMRPAATNNVLGSQQNPLRSVDSSTDLLPSMTPPPLTAPPDDLLPTADTACQGSAVQLTPEMIRAQFLRGEAPVSNSNRDNGATGREQEKLQTEVSCRSELNQMGKQVMARLQQLRAAVESFNHQQRTVDIWEIRGNPPAILNVYPRHSI